MENESFTILPSAARTADTGKEMRNQRHRGVLIIVDVTVDPATADITPRIEIKDENGDFNTIIWSATAAISAVGQFSYLIYPGAVKADFDGTEAAGIPLPLEWKLAMITADADSMTYSVRGHYVN